MSIWQISVLIGLAGLLIGCLVGIWRAIEKAAKGILAVGTQLSKLSDKLERIEAVNGDDTSFEAMEAAFSNFEKLKRIDLPKP